jgi:hypothetical protein
MKMRCKREIIKILEVKDNRIEWKDKVRMMKKKIVKKVSKMSPLKDIKDYKEDRNIYKGKMKNNPIKAKNLVKMRKIFREELTE